MATKIVPNDLVGILIYPPAQPTTFQVQNNSASDIFIDSYPHRLMGVPVGGIPTVGIKIPANSSLSLTSFGAPVYCRAAVYVQVEVVP